MSFCRRMSMKHIYKCSSHSRVDKTHKMGRYSHSDGRVLPFLAPVILDAYLGDCFNDGSHTRGYPGLESVEGSRTKGCVTQEALFFSLRLVFLACFAIVPRYAGPPFRVHEKCIPLSGVFTCRIAGNARN